MNITTGKVLKYTLLPGILPRLYDLFASGFSHVALAMAYIYRAVGLLPAGHPYLDPANAGRYGITLVILEARRNLVFDRAHIDQVIIFFTMLGGLVLLLAQLSLFGLSLIAAPALAGNGDMGAFLHSFFVTEDPTYDIAYIFLERVFGVPGIFGSCVDQGAQCRWDFIENAPAGPVESIPQQFHNGMHALFAFYNIGVLAIGVIILLYFTVAIVAETAQDGTPFGRRFNHAWAPVRLFLAIGLLTPLTLGLNGAQLVTLHVAKWGSSLGSNGWNYFVSHLGESTPMGRPENLVALPNAPTLNTLPEFMFVATTCKIAQRKLYKRDIKGYIVGGEGQPPLDLEETDFDQARDYAVFQAKTGDIVIRFGERDQTYYQNYEGAVRPFCGDITLTLKDYDEPGAHLVHAAYYNIIRGLWNDAAVAGGVGGGFFNTMANNVTVLTLPLPDKNIDATAPSAEWVRNINRTIQCVFEPNPECPTETADYNALQTMANGGQGYFGNGVLRDAQRLQIDEGDWIEDYSRLGWGGAGLWYNKIAQMNGALVGAIFSVPIAHRYPEVMEQVRAQRSRTDKGINAEDRFNPVLSAGNKVIFEDPRDEPMAVTLYYAQHFWQGAAYTPADKNPFLDTIKAIFGINGLFDIRKNLDVSPLAQLTAVGRAMVESAVTNLGFAFAAGIAGGLLNILDLPGAGMGMAAAGLAKTVAMIGLGLGFILYYIIPLLPFIYFFFAIGGWVKAIFEAMVAMPLWALAHVRIDGNGIPGPAAMNGYFLMLDILLRPLFIIFGVVGGIIIFSAQVKVLNLNFDLVTSNMAGFDRAAAEAQDLPLPAGTDTTLKLGTVEFLRGYADQLFHTIIYTICVYMMGMASFKLVEIIPRSILRWIGTGVTPTTEQTGDPGGELVHYAYVGSQGLIGQTEGAFFALMGRNS